MQLKRNRWTILYRGCIGYRFQYNNIDTVTYSLVDWVKT